MSEVVNGLKDKCFLKIKYRSPKHNFFRNKASTGDISFLKTSTSTNSVSLKVGEHNYIAKWQYNNYKNKTKPITFQKPILKFDNILLKQFISSLVLSCKCTLTKASRTNFKRTWCSHS